MNKLPVLGMNINVMYLLLIAFVLVFVADCNTKKNVVENTRVDSVAQATGQRSDDGGGMAMIHEGMDMVKSGKELTDKGEADDDKAMMAQGMSMMDKGMDMMDKGMTRTNKVADKLSKDSTAKDPPLKDDGDM